ncbi:MAG TPA: serine--tRNA ligase [Candidatus Paceibacterota bacterium]|nr:serine--tRNA ligase [Candidatus Paceibacterota bacterium]
MLDIKLIRENPEAVKEGCKKKGIECDIEQILGLDKRKRELLQEIEGLKARQNKLRKEDAEEGRRLKQEIKALEPQLEEVDGGLQSLLTQLPNLPLEDVPVGKDESANVVLRHVGKVPTFDFEPKDHLQLGEELDIIDVQRAAKVVGTRFGYLKGDAVLLEFALVDLAIKTAVKEGFTPVVPPVFLKSEYMHAMGYVDTPEDLAERYFFEKEGLFLVGTSEQSIGAMHANEVFEEKELPKRYVGFSACFREEAGSHGKDTKGIMRVHQFDKAEFVSFTRPEDSRSEHRLLVELEEKLWQALEIPYQVVQLSTGDMGRPHASTIDIEAWMPGQNRYREVSSASNMTDFQARRLNTRYKTKEGKLEFVHMLNATGFPIGRAIIAILENCQQKDGSIKIPKALQQYLGKKEIKSPS